MCFELEDCSDLVTALVYLAEIKEACDAIATQMVERCTFSFVLLLGLMCNSFQRGQVGSTQWQVTLKMTHLARNDTSAASLSLSTIFSAPPFRRKIAAS